MEAWDEHLAESNTVWSSGKIDAAKNRVQIIVTSKDPCQSASASGGTSTSTGTRCQVLSDQHLVLSTQYFLLGTWYLVLSTQYLVPALAPAPRVSQRKPVQGPAHPPFPSAGYSVRQQVENQRQHSYFFTLPLTFSTSLQPSFSAPMLFLKTFSRPSRDPLGTFWGPPGTFQRPPRDLLEEMPVFQTLLECYVSLL